MADESPIDFTTLTLDRERHLVLDMAALRRAERRLRVERLEPELKIWAVLRSVLNDALAGSVGLTEVSILVTEALRAEDPEITEAVILGMLTPANLPMVSMALASAISANFPKPAPGPAPKESGSPLPGKTSGASPG